jgi:hypothetical protein
MTQRRFRYEKHFGMALGVHVVVDAIGFIGFRDGYVHGLMGLFCGAND